MDEFLTEFYLNSCSDSVADHILDPSLNAPVIVSYYN